MLRNLKKNDWENILSYFQYKLNKFYYFRTIFLMFNF